MYEEASAVPLVAAGPSLPAGERCSTAVSLVDIYPTIVEALCGALDERECALPGESLVALAREMPNDRVVFSELHDDGSLTGTFMVRRGNWKLVHYAGYSPQMFDLSADPFETCDLAGDPTAGDIQGQLYDALHRIVDPEAVNERVFADQRARIEQLGGVEGILARAPISTSPRCRTESTARRRPARIDRHRASP